MEKEAEAELNKNDSTGDDIRDMRAREDAEREFQQDRLSDAERESLAEVAIRESQVQNELRIGQIGAQQAAQQLNKLAQQKLQIETNYLNQRIESVQSRLLTDDAKTYAEDLRLYSKLLSDKKRAEQEFQATVVRNNDAALKSQSKMWQGLARGITRDFDFAFHGLISGTESWSTAMARLADNLLDTFLEIPLKMFESWLENSISTLVLGKMTAASQIADAAGVGAANAYAATAAIPIIGPELAPAAAATALANILAFGSVASAAGGMLEVPGDMLAVIHKKESVIPSNVAGPMRDFFASGGKGGTPEVHVHYGDIHAIDASGMEQVLLRHSHAVGKAVRKELRRMNG